MTWDVYKINRPSRLRRAIGFDLDFRQLAVLRPTIQGSSLSLLLLLAKWFLLNIVAGL